MKTVRNLIENFVFDNIEYYADIIDKADDDSEFYGVKIKGDNERLTFGALLETSVYLYLHYKKVGDERANASFERLKRFISRTSYLPLETWSWGCYYVLRALLKMKENNLLQKIDKDVLERIKKITAYTNYYDKEKHCTKNHLPSNYIQVSMALASFREQLGWEDDNFSEEIKNDLLTLMKNGALGGWMDEQPPYGRFDRYSIMVSSEAVDNFLMMKTEIPASMKENLKRALDIALFTANNKGDGINYGRSLSCHGDCAVLEIMSTAFRAGLVDKKDVDKAIAYSIKIIEKTLNFWYDKSRMSFNIWWDGRSTNTYRQSHRVMEVNLDMFGHLLNTLNNFEIAGYADYVPESYEIEEPKEWQYKIEKFIDNENQVSELVILKRKSTMTMLPLIGLGNVYHNMGYMPYPAICGRVEGSPEGHQPYLVPEYKTEAGQTLRPIQYYKNIDVKSENDSVEITAHGNLADMSERFPKATDYNFTTTYIFDKDKITVSFDTDCDFTNCEMYTGTHSNDKCVDSYGFKTKELVKDSENQYDFMTPSGAMTEVIINKTSSKDHIGYIINL